MFWSLFLRIWGGLCLILAAAGMFLRSLFPIFSDVSPFTCLGFGILSFALAYLIDRLDQDT